MIRVLAALALCLSPLALLAQEAVPLTVTDPVVAHAPPGTMTHAAYVTLRNQGDEARQIIGVTATGYAMAHLHRSDEMNGMATMSAVDALEIAPGAAVTFEPGGLHIMLMHPSSSQVAGATVTLTLRFADGRTQEIEAKVTRITPNA
jgi:copper(I)-binding protein